MSFDIFWCSWMTTGCVLQPFEQTGNVMRCFSVVLGRIPQLESDVGIQRPVQRNAAQLENRSDGDAAEEQRR